MSDYRDPYGHYPHPSNGSDTVYNPYDSRQPHPTYEQGGYGEPYGGGYGYRDEPAYPPADSGNMTKERPGVEGDEYVGPKRRLSKNSRAFPGALRYDEDNIWTRGGKGRCIGRFCCCTLLLFVFLFVSIILSLLLWVRPPNVVVGDIGPPSTGSQYQFADDGTLDINLAVNISVYNPNYFSVSFKKIEAEIYYPINNTAIGSGSDSDITFHSDANDTFTFPFAIEYNASKDPNNEIISDILSKCGITGGSSSDITIDYKITVSVKVLFVTVSPAISGSKSFACPLDSSDISDIAKQLGLDDISSLSGLLGGSS